MLDFKNIYAQLGVFIKVLSGHVHAYWRLKNSLKFQQQLGRNVVRLRTRAGLTQEALAERADIHWRYLQKIEKGVNASFHVLLKLKRALDCDWKELFREIE